MESSSGNYIIPFPIKLMAMLEETEAKGLSHIVSWEMEGTAFRVHDPEEFVQQIMGKWFNQTKYKSFQRVSSEGSDWDSLSIMCLLPKETQKDSLVIFSPRPLFV